MDVGGICLVNSVAWNSNQLLKLEMNETIWNERFFEEEFCLDQIEESSLGEQTNDTKGRELAVRAGSEVNSAVEYRRPVVTDARNRLDRMTDSSFSKGEWDP